MTTNSHDHTHAIPGIDTDRIISVEETTRFLSEILEHAGGGLPKVEIENAYNQLVELAISAAMFTMWQDKTLKLGWNSDTQDLTLTLSSSPTRHARDW